jgi:hypothetical protein
LTSEFIKHILATSATMRACLIGSHMHPETPPGLRYSFKIVAEIGEFLPVEQRSIEKLEFIPITGGPVSGELNGEIIPGGGDWCLTRADEAYQVEARYLIRTTEGDFVDVYNVGVLRHLDGESGGPGTMGYFMSAPRFRTTAPELQWLTRSVFVGRAVSTPESTTIFVFEVLR